MSYTELDAWIDEKARGNWPFNQWDVGLLSLRDKHDYCGAVYFDTNISSLHYRLKRAFGGGNNDDLKAALEYVIGVINEAIEHEEYEAKVSWLHSDVWLPMIDENRYGADEPVEMLVDSLNVVDAPENCTEQQLFSALGLWLIGEWFFYERTKDIRLQLWAMSQIALAIAETEWIRGKTDSALTNKTKLAIRNKEAANRRHEPNRARKKAAQLWYMSLDQGSIKQADAARKISSDHSITFEVAKRWATEFERARATNK
jgi:hypothetical protein